MVGQKEHDLEWRVSVREDTVSVVKRPSCCIYLSLPRLPETVFRQFWYFRMDQHQGFQAGLRGAFNLDYASGQWRDEGVFILC